MDKLSDDELLNLEKLHTKIELKCGPIIDELLYEQFPDKSPEERGQIAIHDNMIGDLMSGYILERDSDEIAETIEKEFGSTDWIPQ